jgi:hypothetical protein
MSSTPAALSTAAETGTSPLEMVESYYTNRVKSPTDECRACDQDRTGWCGTWPDDDQAERDAAVRHHLAEALDRIRGA